MTQPCVLLVGCGDVGGRLARRLLALEWTVWGLRRDTGRLPAGVLPVAGDLAQPSCPSAWPQGPLDYVVYCVAASEHDAAGYRQAYVDGARRVLGWLAQHEQRPRRLLFVSSSSVYGQAAGEWVDENAPTVPGGYAGQLMLEAEAVVQDAPFPTTVVRLAGIYGPGRRRLIDQAAQGYDAPREPVAYGNRIHADDAAGLMTHLLLRDRQGGAVAPCYVGVDDAPAPLHEVLAWLRERLGVAVSEGRTVQRTGSKRCSNALARAAGWAPAYSSYREGYAALLAAAEDRR